MKILLKKSMMQVLAIGVLAISLASCKKEKNETPQNQIEDAAGLNVTLNWSMADGTNALNTDLDVYLYEGSGMVSQVAAGDAENQFENFDIIPTLTDGDYTLAVDPYSVSGNGTYTLKVNGKAVAQTYELKNVAFSYAENQEKAVLRINKAGNKYTFTKL
jgi:hypothetical protein